LSPTLERGREGVRRVVSWKRGGKKVVKESTISRGKKKDGFLLLLSGRGARPRQEQKQHHLGYSKKKKKE